MNSCDKALSSATDDSARAAAHSLKGNILAAMAASDRKRLPAAEAEYRAALQLQKSGTAVLHLNLGVVLLRQSRDEEGFRELNTYLEMAPDGEMASYARKLLRNPRRAGDELAPEFEVRTEQGETVSLAQLGGRTLVLDFWATWCPPCVSAVPELKRLTQRYPRENLLLLSVSVDMDEEKWRDFVAKKEMNWAQYLDRDGGLGTAFDIHAIPTYLVIDPEGFITRRIQGFEPQQSVVYRLRDVLQEMNRTPQGK